MTFRRVVTIRNVEGKSTLASDGPSPAARALRHTPGFVMRPLWLTKSPTRNSTDGAETTQNIDSLVPPPGGSTFFIVTFPPDSVMQSPDFDPERAYAEHLEVAPGITELMEPDNPGMHATPTLDYGIVLEGEVWLELDDGEMVHMKKNDVVVQNGARHAWRNTGDQPVTMAFVMVGAAA